MFDLSVKHKNVLLILKLLTPNEKVTTNNKHNSDGCQHKPSTVSVVFVANKTDPTNWVSIHLWSTTQHRHNKLEND